MAEALAPGPELELQDLINTSSGEIDRTFGPYSELGEHLEWLKRFLAEGHIKFKPGMTILELASGVGQSAEIIWGAIPEEIKPSVRFIISDPDKEALDQAKEKFGDWSNIEYVHASAQKTLKSLEGEADTVFYLNGVHNDPDLKEVFEMINGALINEEARFVFNSTFIHISEAIPQSEANFYKKWMIQQRRFLKKEYPWLFTYLASQVNFEENRVEFYDKLIENSEFEMIPIDGFELDNPNSQLQTTMEAIARIAQYKYFGDLLHVTKDVVIAEDLKEHLWDAITEAYRYALPIAWKDKFGLDKKYTPRNNMIRLVKKIDEIRES